MDLLNTLSLSTEIRIQGVYRHYKGFLYQVIAVATHTETLEPLVVYQALYGDRLVWVRPLSMFLENVIVNDVSVNRFKFLDS